MPRNSLSQPDWPTFIDRWFRAGPEDEENLEVNGDPDSLTGEEDGSGYDEMPGWPDEFDDFEEDIEE